MSSSLSITQACLQRIHSIETKIPHLIGYIYFLIANFCYSILNMNVARASNIPSFQLFYLRVLFPTMMFYAVNNKQGQLPVSRDHNINKLLIFNGIMYLIGGGCLFYGFQVVPLGEATVLFQTNPAIAGILAVFLLKEAYDMIQFSITMLCLIGVILIAKPPLLFGNSIESVAYPERADGIISILISAFCIGLQAVVIKKVVSKIDSNLSAFYIGLIPSILGPVIMLMGNVKVLVFDEIMLVVQIVITGFLAQVFYNRAFKFGDAGKVSIMAYSQIIFGYVLEIYFLGTSPDFYSFLGGMFIFSCTFVRMYKTWKTEGEKMNSLP